MSMKLIRIKVVMDRTGLARSTVYKYISEEKIPEAHQTWHPCRCLGRKRNRSLDTRCNRAKGLRSDLTCGTRNLFNVIEESIFHHCPPLNTSVHAHRRYTDHRLRPLFNYYYQSQPSKWGGAPSPAPSHAPSPAPNPDTT